MKLSIVIVNYNVQHFLEQCLLSVRKAIKNIDAEVFVVDNNSVDGSVKMLKEKFHDIILIESKDNLGFSKGNNLAMRQAKGEYILLLNPDTLVEEDTFEKCIRFMDEHPEAGGLGVKMVDGKGIFLPESKRGLPTPAVAFYKIFGLSTLFPKSKKFGAYHLGHLSKDETNEVEILSGAYMFMRKECLDKVGLLDEDYFMYGEDIDLSYRIIKGGYKNYYFADTRIIHYKGESTKKGSLNYVKVFYNAMIIFAKKHFSQNRASLFSFLINMAVYFRAFLAISKRVISQIFHPLLDAGLIYVGLYFIKRYWETNIRYINGGEYPELFMSTVVPMYLLFWVGGNVINGGYDSKSKLSHTLKGIIIGSLILLIVYGLVPEEYRFSRAIVILGSLWAMISSSFTKVLMHFIKTGNLSIEEGTRNRILIVGNQSEANRIYSLINNINIHSSFIGKAYVNEAEADDDYLGSVEQLNELVNIYHIDEIIFCAADITAQSIIDQMIEDDLGHINFKIAPPESMFIIGSNSIHTNGELYMVDVNSITKSSNKRTKRILDLTVCLCLLIGFPLFFILAKNKIGLIKNWFLVVFNQKSWVGYLNKATDFSELPKIKKGVLNPTSSLEKNQLTDKTIKRLNILYAKDYQYQNDLGIIWKSLKHLGDQA